MLAKVNRLVRADDYRAVVRRGARSRTAHTIVYILQNGRQRPSRFGFIVSRTVGNAVKRNLVRRRLKAASYGILGIVASGTDIVIRAIPGADGAPWAVLLDEVSGVIDGMGKR